MRLLSRMGTNMSEADWRVLSPKGARTGLLPAGDFPRRSSLAPCSTISRAMGVGLPAA